MELIIHRASISGVITEIGDDILTVRFNVAGVSEERDFPIGELNVRAGLLSVGMLVNVETSLLLNAELPSDSDIEEELLRIKSEVERELTSPGDKAGTIIGAEPTDALRERSADWQNRTTLKKHTADG